MLLRRPPPRTVVASDKKPQLDLGSVDTSVVDNTTVTSTTTKKQQSEIGNTLHRKNTATPVDFRTEHDHPPNAQDVSTGPDPFPFRAPRQDRVNQLVEYYNQYLRTAAHKQGIEFSLDDFLLQHGGEMFDDLNEQLNGKQHNVSNQNYLITYQRYGTDNKTHVKRIQSILNQDVLKPLDLNELVNIDLVPRRVPIYQEKLNRIHQDHLKAIETEKQSIEQQNKVSRMSQPLSHHGGKHHQKDIERKKTPLPPLQPREMETKSNSSLSEHIIRMPSTTTDVNKSPMSETAINVDSPRDRQTDPYSPVKLLQRDNAPSELARENSSNQRRGRDIATPIEIVGESMGDHRSRTRSKVKLKEYRSESFGGQYPLSALELAIYDSLAESGGLTLSLRGWFLPSLPHLAPLNETLVYLNLSFNCLNTIPAFAFSCVNLQVLKLRNNPITTIPPQISQLKRLRVFIVSFCRVEHLPDALFELPILMFLDASYNQLRQLPLAFGHCQTLRYVNLAGNELRGLPHTALSMSLHKLRLKNNFMHRTFWPDLDKYQPPSLMTAALGVVAKTYDNRKLSGSLREIIRTSQYKCSICNNLKIGQVYHALRPCSSIWGKSNVPFVFKCCSWQCLTSAKIIQSETEM